MSRTFAIGDVHGCLGELESLLSLISYRHGEDSLIFLGDLVDRGPSPVGVVRLIRQLQTSGKVHAIKGNHDEKLARWFRRVREEKELGTPNRMKPPHPHRLAQWEEMDEADRAWLDGLPLKLELPGWIAVHAGFEDIPMAEQRDDRIMRVRWVDPEKGTMVKLGDTAQEAIVQPMGSVFWAERWKGPQSVVYGHTVHSFETPRVDRLGSGVECWGIDTGACYGGRLTALCLETREFKQVVAQKPYHSIVMSGH